MSFIVNFEVETRFYLGSGLLPLIGVFLLLGCDVREPATQLINDVKSVFPAGEQEAGSFNGRMYLLDTLPPPDRRVAPPARPLVQPNNHFELDVIREGLGLELIRKLTPGENGAPLPEHLIIEPVTLPVLPAANQPLATMGVQRMGKYGIRHWGMEHGLMTYDIKSLHQDKDGFLWLTGGGKGLIRLDGASIVQYLSPDPSLINFNHILETPEGDFWLSTGKGIVRFDGNNFESFTHDRLFAHGVRSTFLGPDGKLWAVAHEGGLVRYDGDNNFTSFQTTNGVPNGVINTATDQSGDVWFTASNIIVRYDGQSFFHYRLTGLDGSIPLWQVTIDPAGNLWVGSSFGVVKFDFRQPTYYTWKNMFRGMDVAHLRIDEQDRLWGTTSNDGFFLLQDGWMTMFNEAEGLSSNEVTDLLLADDGNLWIGTFSDGLNRMDPLSFEFLSPAVTGGSTEVLQTAEANDGTIWMGTEKHGLIRYQNGKLWQHGEYEGIWPSPVRGLAVSKENVVWTYVEYLDGILKREGEHIIHLTENQGLASGRCHSLTVDKHQRVWATFDTGFSVIDGNNVVTFDTAVDLRWENIHGFVAGQDDEMWFTTDDELGVIRGEKTFWYGGKDSLPELFIFSRSYDNKHGFWLMTDGAPARFYQDTLYVYELEETEGYSVRDIVVDPFHDVWFGTEFGVYRGEMKNDSPVIVDALHIADGLLSETIENRGMMVDRDTVLWIANAGGVVRLDLKALQRRPPAGVPTTRLTDIAINETNLYFTEDSIIQKNGNLSPAAISYRRDQLPAFTPEGLSVPHRYNHFTFNFIALKSTVSHKIRYQHRLLGQDTDWSTPSKDHQIDYRGLPHGTYTFEARAAGPSGVWGEALNYSFVIRPPWWYTWWAYLIYLGLAVATSIFVLRRFQRRIELKAALDNEQAEADRLRELDNFKSRLFTNLTHEFRTPLTVILGMARQLRAKPEEALPASQLIERNGESMLRLVNQLLDLSKLENQAFTLNMKQGDIIPFLRFLTHSFSSYAEGENITLQFSSAEDHLVMDFDEEQIQQILSNLISNAVKFTPSEGEIEVTALRSATDLKIRVSDTGIGIAPAEQGNIFNRFYQVDGTTTRKGEGTGIGLAHTQELVHLMEGHIALESKLGEGSVFTVTLPIRTETPKKEINFPAANRLTWLPSSKALPSLPEQPVASNEELPLLLVVEDNVDVVTYLKSCLESACQVEVALNGRIGVDMALELIPDVIISDVMMPEMDGFQLCDALKNDERTSHVPIILLTAKADIQSKLAGLRRGADAYLSKPFDREELLIRLDGLMERQRRMAAYFSGRHPEEVIDPALVPEEILVEDAFVQKLRNIVAEHYQDENFNLSQLCDLVYMSRSQLFRKLKALADISPSAFIRNHRLDAAKKLLFAGDLTVAEVGYAVGFKDPAHFSKVFREAFGVPPSEYV